MTMSFKVGDEVSRRARWAGVNVLELHFAVEKAA